ncbi:hypothetical protein FQN50_008545 [Emmonsiellopsis sp. PD_5]|nr:hypothetical protein FQN50_008545 [Emmonsiellopsis sp. PD_5]
MFCSSRVPTEYPGDEDPEEKAKLALPEIGPLCTQEINSLTHFNKMGCSVTPRLLTWVPHRQALDMPIPDGYIVFLVMEKVPGVPLDNFRTFSFDKREKIRAAFRRALTELDRYGADPADTRLANLIYDEENDKCYIVDYEDIYVFPDGISVDDDIPRWRESNYRRWGLAE